MEKHKCKLCTRSFINGRALGGHMKAHLASLPLPIKTRPQLGSGGHRTESGYCYSSSSSEEEDKTRETGEKSVNYGLRENPKRSFRVANSELVDSGCVVQDGESETESKNPTRRRSKRRSKSSVVMNQRENLDVMKQKLKKPSWSESVTEQEPASSVSDTSPDEDVAICLMMLSRDVWEKNSNSNHKIKEAEKSEDSKTWNPRVDYNCGKCREVFRSHHALVTHKKSCLDSEKIARNNGKKIFECPFCFKMFASGQALGGHKRSHFVASASTSSIVVSTKPENNWIDLNLPAPLEDDQFSVVSDA